MSEVSRRDHTHRRPRLPTVGTAGTKSGGHTLPVARYRSHRSTCGGSQKAKILKAAAEVASVSSRAFRSHWTSPTALADASYRRMRDLDQRRLSAPMTALVRSSMSWRRSTSVRATTPSNRWPGRRRCSCLRRSPRASASRDSEPGLHVGQRQPNSSRQSAQGFRTLGGRRVPTGPEGWRPVPSCSQVAERSIQ